MTVERPPGNRAADPSILILVPHFGAWPEWLPLFLETCRWNPTVRWLLISDCGSPLAPPNVAFQSMSFDSLRRRVAAKLGYEAPLPNPYKLCDLRLAFGTIFDDFVSNADYFGWSDLDVIYGNIRAFLTESMLRNDVITFNAEHLSGHFTLLRNTAAIRTLHLEVPDWRTRVCQKEYMHLDEPEPAVLRQRFSVWAEESYNTPLSQLIPWRDGTFTFPGEWYWRDGRLTNDLDAGIEFLYLHFMHWKGGAWPRECGNAQWERLTQIVHLDPREISEGFRINEHGFFALSARIMGDGPLSSRPAR